MNERLRGPEGRCRGGYDDRPRAFRLHARARHQQVVRRAGGGVPHRLFVLGDAGFPSFDQQLADGVDADGDHSADGAHRPAQYQHALDHDALGEEPRIHARCTMKIDLLSKHFVRVGGSVLHLVPGLTGNNTLYVPTITGYTRRAGAAATG